MAAASAAGAGPARPPTPRPELGCWRRSAALAGLGSRAASRKAGPLPARVLLQRLSAPRQPGGGGGGELQPHGPLHIYFSDGSSRCCRLGKRFLPRPAEETDTSLHFISPRRLSGSQQAFFLRTANGAVDTDLPFKRGEMPSPWQQFRRLGPSPAPSRSSNTNLREKGRRGGAGRTAINRFSHISRGFSTILKLCVGKVLLSLASDFCRDSCRHELSSNFGHFYPN